MRSDKKYSDVINLNVINVYDIRSSNKFSYLKSFLIIPS